MVREPDLAVSMINPNLILFNKEANLVKKDNKLNFFVESWCPIDSINDFLKVSHILISYQLRIRAQLTV